MRPIYSVDVDVGVDGSDVFPELVHEAVNWIESWYEKRGFTRPTLITVDDEFGEQFQKFVVPVDGHQLQLDPLTGKSKDGSNRYFSLEWRYPETSLVWMITIQIGAVGSGVQVVTCSP